MVVVVVDVSMDPSECCTEHIRGEEKGCHCSNCSYSNSSGFQFGSRPPPPQPQFSQVCMCLNP